MAQESPEQMARKAAERAANLAEALERRRAGLSADGSRRVDAVIESARRLNALLSRNNGRQNHE